MSITIKWINRNTVALDGIKVYRSTTRNGATTLIGSIAGTSTTLTDNTAIDDTLYFYRVDAILGDSVTYSAVIPMRNVTNIGPGPTTILRGDWEFGLLGEVAPALLPTWAQVKTAAGNNIQQAAASPTNWAKWIIGGRIVFIPNNILGSSMSAATISTNPTIAAGKLFVASGADRLTNGAKITVGSYNFLARLPYASTLVTTEQNPNNEITMNSSTGVIINPGSTFTKSEIIAFIKSISQAVDALSVSDKLRYDDFTLANFVTQNYFTNTFVESSSKVLTISLTGGQWVDSLLLSTSTVSAGIVLPIIELLPAS